MARARLPGRARRRAYRDVIKAECGRHAQDTLASAAALADGTPATGSATFFTPPAGTLPASRDTVVDGTHVVVLPNGRFLTPAGNEVAVDAPKPFTLDVSRDGKTAITVNSGSSRFSVTLLTGLDSANPIATQIPIDATFLGVALSPDGKRFYVSGGDNSIVLVGDVAARAIVGSVNLNGPAHPVSTPFDPTQRPGNWFKGAFPGGLVLSPDGRWLYVVDQAAFAVHAIDTRLIVTGTDGTGRILEPNNATALVSSTKVGRYPFGIGVSPDGKQLIVTNVGQFQYSHLTPANPAGSNNLDYPLCYPGTSYPDDMVKDKTIAVAFAHGYLYVSNGGNDTVSVVDPRHAREVGRIALTLLHG